MKITRNIHIFLKLFGLNPLVFINSARNIWFYYRDLKELKRQKGEDKKFVFGRNYPILHERFSGGGVLSGDYFHQDLFVARKIYENKPVRHLDIGSRMDGFVAHVAVFREIEIVDIRQTESTAKNILFRQCDFMKLPEDMVNAFDSISSLHAIEHFGLGRYGDPVDYNGHIKAINNIYKALKPGGKFYFSVPIGEQRIEFNANRVFSIDYLISILTFLFSINSFVFVDDKGNFHNDAQLTPENIKSNFGCYRGCGIFELTKI